MANPDEVAVSGEVNGDGSFTARQRVKNRPSRISSKNQITIPVRVLAEAGLEAGDLIRVQASGPGTIILQRDHDPVADYAGSLDGVYEADELSKLRG